MTEPSENKLTPKSLSEADWLEGVVQDTLDHVARLVTAPPAAYPQTDRPRTITIVGGRGSGKSTLLRKVVNDLSQREDCLVLPVIEPEVFAPGESLGGWALAHLERSMSESEKTFSVSDDAPRLNIAIQELRRAYAVRSSAFLVGLEGRGLTFDEFARDAARMPLTGARFPDQWSAFLDALAVAREAPGLQLIVPIDDADVCPQLLPSVVEDARLLGLSARTIIIFTADHDTLVQGLEIGVLSSFGRSGETALQQGLLSTSDIREWVARSLTKNFPRSLRVPIPDPTQEQCLSFTPIGATESIRDLLSQFKCGVLPGFQNLSDLYTIKTVSGQVLRASDHVWTLSQNARDLRQLHEALAGMVVSSRQKKPDESAGLAMALLLQHGVESAEAEVPIDRPAPLIIGLPETGNPRLTVDLAGITFGKTSDVGARVYRQLDIELERDPDNPMATQVTVRRISGFYARYASIGNTDDDPRPPRVSSQMAHLIFLAFEVSQPREGSGLLDLTLRQGDFSLPGGMNWPQLVRGVPRPENESPYWPVPLWEEYSDYYVYTTGWNRVIDGLRRYTPLVGRPELLEFLLLTHLRLVLTTQRLRRVPDDIADLSATWFEEFLRPAVWDELRLKLMAEVQSGCAALLPAHREVATQREGDFLYWVEAMLPLAGTRYLTTQRLADWLLTMWAELVPDAEHRWRASDVIADAVGRNLGTALADWDLRLLQQVDADRAERLRDVQTQISRQLESQRIAVINQLREAAIPADILEALRSVGATNRVVGELHAHGIRNEDLAAIAELFPVVELSAEPTDRSIRIDDE